MDLEVQLEQLEAMLCCTGGVVKTMRRSAGMSRSKGKIGDRKSKQHRDGMGWYWVRFRAGNRLRKYMKSL
jgi:hypothetical protein